MKKENISSSMKAKNYSNAPESGCKKRHSGQSNSKASQKNSIHRRAADSPNVQ